MSDLKPCPFCGERAQARSEKAGYRIGCMSPLCMTDSGKFPTEAEATAAWNQRTTEPARVAEWNEEADGVLDFMVVTDATGWSIVVTTDGLKNRSVQNAERTTILLRALYRAQKGAS